MEPIVDTEDQIKQELQEIADALFLYETRMRSLRRRARHLVEAEFADAVDAVCDACEKLDELIAELS